MRPARDARETSQCTRGCIRPQLRFTLRAAASDAETLPGAPPTGPAPRHRRPESVPGPWSSRGICRPTDLHCFSMVTMRARERRRQECGNTCSPERLRRPAEAGRLRASNPLAPEDAYQCSSRGIRRRSTPICTRPARVSVARARGSPRAGWRSRTPSGAKVDTLGIRPRLNAHDDGKDRGNDEVLYPLSYAGRTRRRDSNPRPPAWQRCSFRCIRHRYPT